jgi:integral membrane sensor domain MASE1
MFLAQRASVILWVPPTRLSTIWIHGGLLLGIVLLVPRRRWPLVLVAGALGQALVLITMGIAPLPAALLVCSLNASVTCVLGLALGRVLPQGFPLATVREFMIYLLTVAVGGAVLASTAFLFAAAVTDLRPATFEFWRTFALAAVLAYVTVTPAVVYLVQGYHQIRHDPPKRRMEAAALTLLLGVSAGLVFMGDVSPSVTWPTFGFTVVPLLLWAAVRFGTFGVSASLLFVTTISTLGTGRGLGPFTGQSPEANTMTLQFFMLATGLPFMALSIVLTGQRRATAALRSTHTRLRAINRDLVQAREEESSRIARELHDDIGQQLALVSIGLSRLRGSIADSASGPSKDVTLLQAQTGSIVRSLREISHLLARHLRPSE